MAENKYNSNNRPSTPGSFQRNPRGPFRRQVEKEPYNINEHITATHVRVVGENIEVGIYPIEQAIKIAQEQNLDLVEISPNANPPVCKVIDYQKFKYDQKKKQKELKAKTQKTALKEIRFGPNTDEHDLNFKIKHAENFLKEGNKVKAYVQFMGRTIVYQDRGHQILKQFMAALEDFGKVEQEPKLEGRRLGMLIAPKPKK